MLLALYELRTSWLSCIQGNIGWLQHWWTLVVVSQRGKVGQTSWDCQEELFRQEVENADDVRLSYRLLRKCMGDKQKFCADIKPGGCLTPSQHISMLL